MVVVESRRYAFASFGDKRYHEYFWCRVVENYPCRSIHEEALAIHELVDMGYTIWLLSCSACLNKQRVFASYYFSVSACA